MTTKHRISKVTTRAGDRGTTKLATGRTIGKHEPLIQVIGSVDELNSHIGALTASASAPHQTSLKQIQQTLFDVGAVFATEGKAMGKDNDSYPPPDLSAIEKRTEQLNNQLPPLTEFVLPGGGAAAAQSHICRAVCRRAETDLWRVVHAMEEVPASFLAAARYLNRLSDFFFVLARTLTTTTEDQWQGPSKR